MTEYIEKDKPFSLLKNYLNKPNGQYSAQEVVYLVDDLISDIPAADVVEVQLLDDGTLIVTTDKYPNVTRVFVEDGKTSGSLFYADEV